MKTDFKGGKSPGQMGHTAILTGIGCKSKQGVYTKCKIIANAILSRFYRPTNGRHNNPPSKDKNTK
jgi:hypothetical protein